MDKIHKNMLIIDRKRKFDDLFNFKTIALSLGCAGGIGLIYYYIKHR